MIKPLYYLGCKASFSEPITQALDDLDRSSGRACDLFAGSGAVGVALAADRDVTTVDIQEYSRVICSAQLRPATMSPSETSSRASMVAQSDLRTLLQSCLGPLIDYESEAIRSALNGQAEELVGLLEATPLILSEDDAPNSHLAGLRRKVRKNLKDARLWGARESTLCLYFGGVYFSFEQTAYLDAAASLAKAAPADLADTLLAATLSSASSIVNTVGKQFAQPIRPRNKLGEIKNGIGSIAHRDRSIDVESEYLGWLKKYSELSRTNRNHIALKMDFYEAISRHGDEFSIIYADPPYTRDHYSRFYHVLETICLQDLPKISEVKKNGIKGPSRGLYREDRHQSPFCIRSEAPKALSKLFEAACSRNVPVLLSYSPHEAGDGTHPRVMSANDIISIARGYFRNVEVELIDGSTHNKLNRADLGLAKRSHAEMLVKCKNGRRF